MGDVSELNLSPEHCALLTASAVSPEIVKTRGYWTATKKTQLKDLGFSYSQWRVPALVIPVYDVTGEITLHQLRPDKPRARRDGKHIKYETPKNARMVLDVHPYIREHLTNPKRPLFITGGVRKADSAISLSLCCIALLGVWNWRGTGKDGGKTALSDWEYIALNGREVYIVFDSDIMLKQEVQQALARLKRLLGSRGALVRLIYLEPGADGSKVGMDDCFAAGHTVEDLMAKATDELRHEAEEQKRPPSQATQLVAMAGDAGLWHTPDGEHWATITIDSHQEHWQLKVKAFRRWLVRRFYEQGQTGPGAQALQDALNVLEGKALFDGEEHPVFVRGAEHSGAIYSLSH